MKQLSMPLVWTILATACNFLCRFWDPDDGWKIGALCISCWLEVRDDKPKPDDYAYHQTNGVADDVETDLDPSIVL